MVGSGHPSLCTARGPRGLSDGPNTVFARSTTASRGPFEDRGKTVFGPVGWTGGMATTSECSDTTMDVPTWMAVLRLLGAEFRGARDRVAMATHAKMLADGWRLCEAGRNAAERDAGGVDRDTTDVDVDGRERRAFGSWNELEDGEYAFVYQKQGTEGAVKVRATKRDDSLRVEATWLRDGAETHGVVLRPLEHALDAPGSEIGITKPRELDEALEGILCGLREERRTRRDVGGGGAPMGRGGTEPGVMPPPSGEVPLPPVRVGDADRFPWVQPRFDGVGGGGSQVGPDHPIFDGEREPSQQQPPMPGIPCPPGARWDPIQPPGVPGFLPGDLTRQTPAPRRGRPPTHPDMMQPGSEEDGGSSMLPPRSRGPYGQGGPRGPGGSGMPPFL